MTQDKNIFPTQDELDTSKIVSYLKTLVQTPSPTGFTDNISRFLREHAQKRGIYCQETRKGAILYCFRRGFPGRSTMLCSHVDTLGAIVRKVEANKLKIGPIGGYPALYAIGDYCTVHAFDGQKYSGTILPENPSHHVHDSLNKFLPTFDNVQVRVDFIPGEGKKLEDYISNGSYVSFDPHFQYVNGFIKTRHLDDKASAAVLLRLADLLLEESKLCGEEQGPLYIYFNVTEETGQGMAAMPEIDDLIAVDMGCIGKGLNGDEFSVSICPKDSTGPYHYLLTQKLINLAKKKELSYQIDIFPHYGSDASVALRSGKDIRTALIGPGIDASHGYERTHEKALINTLGLLKAYLGS